MPRPPCTRYSKAWATVALGTVDAAVSWASGAASPPKASSGIPPVAAGAAQVVERPGPGAGPAEQADQDDLDAVEVGAARSRWPAAARTGGKPSGSPSTRDAQGQELARRVGEEEDHDRRCP